MHCMVELIGDDWNRRKWYRPTIRPASRLSSPPDGLCFLHTFQLCNISLQR